MVDDHPLFLQGMVLIMRSLLPTFTLSTAANFAETKQALKNKIPDLLLLDLFLPDQDGFEGLKELTYSYPTLTIAILTSSEDKKHIQNARYFGAKGYICKTSSPDELLIAINKLLAGEYYFPHICPSESSILNKKNKLKLTSRQAEILHLVSEGQSNKNIAKTLFISEGTVKQHLHKVFKVLKVKNRQQAVQYYDSID